MTILELGVSLERGDCTKYRRLNMPRFVAVGDDWGGWYVWDNSQGRKSMYYSIHGDYHATKRQCDKAIWHGVKRYGLA